MQWVQLNPANTFVLQDVKEDWLRYAIPMVAACLRAFAKKALISNWEDALLNLCARSFVHVTYGDPDNKVLPTIEALSSVQSLFRQAMTGSALAVTNNWCKSHTHSCCSYRVVPAAWCLRSPSFRTGVLGCSRIPA